MSNACMKPNRAARTHRHTLAHTLPRPRPSPLPPPPLHTHAPPPPPPLARLASQAAFAPDPYQARHRAELIEATAEVAWMLFAKPAPTELRAVLCAPPPAMQARLCEAMAASLAQYSTFGLVRGVVCVARVRGLANPSGCCAPPALPACAEGAKPVNVLQSPLARARCTRAHTHDPLSP